MLEREKLLRDNIQSYSIRMVARADKSLDCEYECTNDTAYVVQGEVENRLVTFTACRECLNEKEIYPVKNGWVGDE